MLHHKKLSYIEPIAIFWQVAKLPGVIFLDSSKTDELYGRYSFIMFEPLVSYLSGKNQQQIKDNIIFNNNIEEAISLWQELFQKNISENKPDFPPFTGGLAGYFSYDLSKQIESIPACAKSIIPDYVLGLYNKVFAFDHNKKECFIFIREVDGFQIDVAAELEYLLAIYAKAKKGVIRIKPLQIDLPSIKITSNFSQDEYVTLVKKVQEYILNGDAYEVNIAQRFVGEVDLNYPIFELYQKLRALNSAPFSAYLDLKHVTEFEFQLLSASPERFLAIKDRCLEARPIKGTIRKSDDAKEDKKLIAALASSEKDRAENIMIVDLLRNDLGKICKTGSIKVSQLCGIESFTNLHHMVSVITGELKEDKSIFDIIIAAFPGGSVTGAPKVRAMQIIEELEQTSRGVYCGSIGYFGFNGNVDLSIAIRTIIRENNELKFYAGGAVTQDSSVYAEYAETLLKAEKILEVINGKTLEL